MKLDSLPFGDRIAGALPYLATAAIVIGFINFFWFIGESMSIGDAAQGRIVDGHYYLNNKGTYTEVTKAAWDWSVFHGASIVVTHPLALAGMAYLILRRAFPAQMAGSASTDPELVRRRLELVRGSGPLIAQGSMGGSIGSVRMTTPLLEVSVYPKGLIVRARLMSQHAIFAAEIVSVEQRRIYLQQGVEVTHLGLGSRSPLILYRAGDDPVIAAIRRVIAAEAAAPVSVANEEAAAPAPPAVEPAPFPPTPALLSAEDKPARSPWRLPGWQISSDTPGPSEPAIPGIDPRLSTVLEVAGLAVGVVLLIMGVVYAIPKLGPFGVDLDHRRRGDPGLQRSAVHAPTLRVGHPLDADSGSADPHTPARIIRATTKNQRTVRTATCRAASSHGAGETHAAASATAAPRTSAGPRGR